LECRDAIGAFSRVTDDLTMTRLGHHDQYELPGNALQGLHSLQTLKAMKAGRRGRFGNVMGMDLHAAYRNGKPCSFLARVALIGNQADVEALRDTSPAVTTAFVRPRI